MRFLTLAFTFALFAQAPLSFEVASVKPGVGERVGEPTSSVPGRFPPGGRFEAVNSQLLTIIRRAYDEFTQPGQIVGPPELLEARFDIDARAASDVPERSVRLMLRQLLVDRFKMKVHTETRIVDGHELVLDRRDGKLGPRIRPAKTNCKGIEPQMVVAPGKTVACGLSYAIQDGMWRYYFGGRSIGSLRSLAETTLGHRVIDATGLTGAYDIELSWRADATDLDGPSLQAAIKEQLGLRLQPAKVELAVLVIDHLERPTPN